MTLPYDLPPGCTDADLTRAAGDEARCLCCGEWVRAEALVDGWCGRCRREEGRDE